MVSQKDRWLQNVVIMSQYKNVVIHEAKIKKNYCDSV